MNLKNLGKISAAGAIGAAIGNIARKFSNVGPEKEDTSLSDYALTEHINNLNLKYKGKYDVNNLTYPEDLFGNATKYGNNYAMFYINVAEDSKLISQRKAETVDITNDERLSSQIREKGIKSTDAAGAYLQSSTAIGAIVGSPGVGGAIGLVSAASVATLFDGKLSRQQKRLKSAIALNVPNELSIRYGTLYSDEETLAFQTMAEFTSGSVEAIESSIKNKSINASSLTTPVKSALTNLALNAPGLGGALSAASGLTPNPKKEQVFKGVDFRTFTFEYRFAPKSENELKNVMNIIQTFKYHMHPEFKDTAAFTYVYPSEFDIHYYHREGENTFIHKHTSCVLRDMTINYTPNGVYSSFENGAPTQINVQLSFVELAILTKDQIEMGY